MQGFNIGYRAGNGFTALCHSQANGKQESDFFGKERESNGVQVKMKGFISSHPTYDAVIQRQFILG
ncbi:nuclear transcription factor Y subunit A7 [Trifolium medium]|uniref:Nuclear transcription factor Y subunit A7 n=1 Tax=Trifolium medium TaxID=97028 RepID=A0A392Q8X7_9FABA|nr:nuclear transcription factor Y subunit A7 [Trifolium medium]